MPPTTEVDRSLEASAETASPFAGPAWESIDAALREVERRVDAEFGNPAVAKVPPAELMDAALDVWTRLDEFLVRWNAAAQLGDPDVYWRDTLAAQAHIRRWTKRGDRLASAMQRTGGWRSYGRTEQFLEALAQASFDAHADLAKIREIEDRFAADEAAYRSASAGRVAGAR